MNVAELGYEIDSADVVSAERNLDGMTGAAQRAEREAGRLMRQVAGLVGVIGGFAAVSRAFDRAFRLDRSIGELATLLPGATAEIEYMEQAAVRLARQYGTNTRTQAAAYYDAVSSGATTAAVATARLGAANTLALGGAADLDPSLRVLNTAVNAYGEEMLSAADAADTLFTGVRFGVTTVSEMSSSIGRAIPTATALGISFQELVGAVAALTTQGQDTPLAVTGITAALSQIIAPSQQAQELARQLGIEFNAAGIEAMGFAGFMEHVVDATGGSQEQLATLFGSVEALRAVLSLAGRGGETFAEIMEGMEDRLGAADQAAAAMAERASQKWAVAMANLGTMSTQFGQTLLNTVAPAALEFTNVLVGAEDANLALEIAMKGVAATAGVLAVTHIGGLTASFLASIPAVRAYVAAVALVGPVSATATVATTALSTSLRFLMGPAGLVLTAAAGLTAAWVAYGDSQDEARWATEDLNDLLREQEELESRAAESTEEGAQTMLGKAMAIREATAALIEQRRVMLQAQYDALAGPQYGGAMMRDLQDQSTLGRIRDLQQDIAEAEQLQVETLGNIEKLEQRIAGFRATAREEREDDAETAHAEFQAILDGYRAEFNALSLSRDIRLNRLAVMKAEAELNTTLSDTQRDLLLTEVELLRTRENMIDVYDRIKQPVQEYQDDIAALDRLLTIGEISAGEFWDALFDNRLVQHSRDLDAYLRSMGASVDLNSIDERYANDNSPFGGMLEEAALAGHQDEILRLQEEYAERQAVLQQMHDADIISYQQYQDRLTALQRAGAAERVDLERQAYAMQMGAASSAFEDIAAITAAFAGEQSGVYKAMFAISKAFAIAESVINIQRAMAQALALPFPANIPAMAAVAAEGASIVAAIQSVADAGFRGGGYTGDMPEHAVAGVVHGQEWVLDAAATRGIGRQNLEYMSRTGRMPSNDNNTGGTTNIFDMTGSLVTRDAVEDLQNGLSNVKTRLSQSEAELPSKVREIRQEDQERGFG